MGGFFFRPGFLLVFALFFLPLSRTAVLGAQDLSAGDDASSSFDSGSFGFGDADGGFGFGGSPELAVRVGGEVSAELAGFYGDFASPGSAGEIRPGNIFSGSLDFEAAGSSARAVIRLDLSPVFDGSSPVELGEAYLAAFFGPLTVEGGLRKVNWGKADSFGPLDVVNPLDYRDLTKLSDPESVKIARPMLRAIWTMGAFSKLEAVFVPWFRGDAFAESGRWTPNQVRDLLAGVERVFGEVLANPMVLPYLPQFKPELETIRGELTAAVASGEIYPDTVMLKYAQGGGRFTTTLGSSDLGFQYYFGRFPRPTLSNFNPALFFVPSANPPLVTDIHPEALDLRLDYNYYHQIAVDFARVVAGFNLRAEAGANISGDLDGTNPAVYNPALVWSLGFDRELLWGITINLQGTGRIRLFHDRIADNFYDCEAGEKLSSSRITGILSRTFFGEELELKTTALWGIEDRDFLIMPGLVWSRNDLSFELITGFFGGDEAGELGQYRDNNYLRLVLSYRF